MEEVLEILDFNNDWDKTIHESKETRELFATNTLVNTKYTELTRQEVKILRKKMAVFGSTNPRQGWNIFSKTVIGKKLLSDHFDKLSDDIAIVDVIDYLKMNDFYEEYYNHQQNDPIFTNCMMCAEMINTPLCVCENCVSITKCLANIVNTIWNMSIDGISSASVQDIQNSYKYITQLWHNLYDELPEEEEEEDEKEELDGSMEMELDSDYDSDDDDYDGANDGLWKACAQINEHGMQWFIDNNEVDHCFDVTFDKVIQHLKQNGNTGAKTISFDNGLKLLKCDLLEDPRIGQLSYSKRTKCFLCNMKRTCKSFVYVNGEVMGHVGTKCIKVVEAIFEYADTFLGAVKKYKTIDQDEMWCFQRDLDITIDELAVAIKNKACRNKKRKKVIELLEDEPVEIVSKRHKKIDEDSDEDVQITHTPAPKKAQSLMDIIKESLETEQKEREQKEREEKQKRERKRQPPTIRSNNFIIIFRNQLKKIIRNGDTSVVVTMNPNRNTIAFSNDNYLFEALLPSWTEYSNWFKKFRDSTFEDSRFARIANAKTLSKFWDANSKDPYFDGINIKCIDLCTWEININK